MRVPRLPLQSRAVTTVVVLFAAGLAFALLYEPVLTLTGLAAVTIMTAVVLHPPLAAYVLAGTTVLVAGISRGSVSPVLRPSEAVLLVVGLALGLRTLIRSMNGDPPEFAFTIVDGSLVLFAVTGSVLPLLWLTFRGEPVTSDDVLFALALWKVYAVFLVVRISVRTERQVLCCLWLSMSAAAIVAAIAVLQALDLFGVRDLILTFYPPSEQIGLDPNRGSSTLGSSLVTANVMSFNLAIALACLAVLRKHRQILLAGAAMFVLGGLASGQFSAVIGLAGAVVAVGLVAGHLTRRVFGLVIAGVAGGFLLQPLIERRLSGFRSGGGVPSSWLARLDNLRTYFWPELFSDFHYVLGVRPAARVVYPGPGEVFVWIESGHTWLLWTGGIPMLVAFIVFMGTTMRSMLRLARDRPAPTGAAALAAFAVLSVIVVLMIFDPQLTGRGEGELAFTLLGLAMVSPDRTGSGLGQPP